MGRVLAFAYGLVVYLMFLYTFLAAVWFVWTMDGMPPKEGTWLNALIINAVLLSIFAIQHSVMARQPFKRAITKVISPAIERTTFVLATNIALLALIKYWHPIPGVVWSVDSSIGIMPGRIIICTKVFNQP